MAVKMRLTRMGKKRSPYYRVVVVDGRAPRDGKYIELIGRYDPNQDPSLIEISGAMSHYKVTAGTIHGAAGSAPPVADAEAAVEASEPIGDAEASTEEE